MLYKNTKTGRIIDVQSEIGGNWVLVVAPSSSEPAETPPKKPASKTGKKAKEKANG